MKMTEVAQTVGHFIQLLSSCIHFDKNGSGYILGEFLTNSSGRPKTHFCQNQS
jgi:hypothetical protein